MTDAAMDPRPLGALLVEAGKIALSDLDRALDLQRSQGGRLGAILVRLGALSEDALLQVLSQQLGMTVIRGVDLSREAITASLEARQLDRQWLARNQCLLWDDEDGNLHIAAPDPLSMDLQDALEALGSNPQLHLMRAEEYERLLGLIDAPEWTGELDAQSLRELAEDAPVISFVNSLVAQAMDERASDIHLEPGERVAEVRFRLDGALYKRNEISAARYAAVSSRIKLIAGLDIAERRLPQDGRITLRAAGTELDVRVSTIPAVHGESVVMRLLPKQRQELALDRLGLEPDDQHSLERWLKLPNGLVLVTGPTGSGKSTTLYAALSAVDDRSRKILTVEDPVEVRLPNIIQVQTQSEIGYTFARALRAMLRHDPDVIMVGEIRDRETAEMAIQAALTGHLVLSTLHTNDAAAAFTRLIDMGVEPYLVSAAVQGVMAQRLVRRLCAECRAPIPQAEIPADIQAVVADIEAPTWYRPVGCSHCQGTGYRGRIAVHEMLDVTDRLRHDISTEAPLEELRQHAVEQGYIRLRDAGLRKAARGITSIEDVIRMSMEVAQAGTEAEPVAEALASSP